MKGAAAMNGLIVFGVVAVTAMLVFYAAEGRSPAYVLAFAAACLMASLYGFLQGAWPFGIVEAVWSAIAVRRWWLRKSGTAFAHTGRLNTAVHASENGGAA